MARLAVLAAAAALALSGCSPVVERGFLPKGVTTDAPIVTNLWVNSWIAALAVGALVWGLIIFSVVAYRRRKDDDHVPTQLRYNLPIEILYSVIPLFMIGALFYYTARDETTLLKVSAHPDNVVNVVGKRWAWDFNYLSNDVYEATTQTPLTGTDTDQEKAPILYLPVDKSTQFVLTSRDVIHSFWVPAFLMKLDMLPGMVNTFQVTPTDIGTYRGKCAELCGAYHSQMLFQVKVVSQADYDQHMADLKAKGQTGLLPNSLSPEQLVPGQAEKIPNVGGQ
ncbi:cytochrome c oxidase subunit II [Angustibacter sp. McL0619]|uniref:aa3-type cytochrome oxidase subunit II n=1 Tax=Angustibacter sp. McL0619 TaxID=3415676 RepID=UPI003CF98A95